MGEIISKNECKKIKSEIEKSKYCIIKGKVEGLVVDLEEMKENLLVALAKGCCRNVSRSEVHDLIDEIYDEYEIDN